MAELFFSYSHKDEALRNELETHLSTLKRQGMITAWHDRRIGAGQEVHGQISEYLERADIILLLVSSDFLDSDYCYDTEMSRAMERHEQGTARVIPVILRPCDWQGAPFGKLLAVPTDGKPVTMFPSQDEAFLEISQAVRKAAEAKGAPAATQPAAHGPHSPVASPADTSAEIRSSNLRIKKTFSDREKDLFLEDAFEYIAKFFEGSLSELKNRNAQIDASFRRIDANHFTAAVYDTGRIASQCKIWFGGRNSFANGIAYSSSLESGDNSLNESLSVDDDGYALFLKPSAMGFHYQQQGNAEQLTYQGAAEYYWGIFIEPLQR
jgi:TIR domain